MSFSFTGRHMDIGQSLTDHAKESCNAACEKFGFHMKSATAVMEKDSFLFVTELSLETTSGEIFQSKQSTKDPYSSFDHALHKIVSQMKKYKEKEISTTHEHKHREVIVE